MKTRLPCARWTATPRGAQYYVPPGPKYHLASLFFSHLYSCSLITLCTSSPAGSILNVASRPRTHGGLALYPHDNHPCLAMCADYLCTGLGPDKACHPLPSHTPFLLSSHNYLPKRLPTFHVSTIHVPGSTHAPLPKHCQAKGAQLRCRPNHFTAYLVHICRSSPTPILLIRVPEVIPYSQTFFLPQPCHFISSLSP